MRILSIANAQRHAGKQAMGSQAAAQQVAGGGYAGVLKSKSEISRLEISYNFI